MINERIEELKEDLVKDTQKILRINSVVKYNEDNKKFGNGAEKVLEETLNIAKNMGFKTVNLDGMAGYVEYGEGDEYVAALGHLDVVPEGDGWVYPPYGAEIHDGKIYARGSLDDKGPMMATLYGLKAVKDLGLKLSKKIRIIFGIDEENGSDLDIERYLKSEPMPCAGFTPDAEFPIVYAEKGILTFELKTPIIHAMLGNAELISMNGGVKHNMVPDYCEAVIKYDNLSKVLDIVDEIKRETLMEIKVKQEKEHTISIKTYGISAHGSTPEKGKNAIVGMCKVLHAFGGDTVLAKYIELISETIGLDTTGKGMGVAMEDEPSGALSYNLGVIKFDGRKIVSTSNLRYPVTFNLDDVLDPLNKIAHANNYKLDVLMHQKPLYIDKNSELIKTLQKVYTEETGKEAILLSMGGGTYAKSMNNIVAFGPIFPGKPDLDHQANEYIEIDDLVSCAKIYGKALYELAK